jgi:hypothetical protein
MGLEKGCCNDRSNIVRRRLRPGVGQLALRRREIALVPGPLAGQNLGMAHRGRRGIDCRRNPLSGDLRLRRRQLIGRQLAAQSRTRTPRLVSQFAAGLV